MCPSAGTGAWALRVGRVVWPARQQGGTDMPGQPGWGSVAVQVCLEHLAARFPIRPHYPVLGPTRVCPRIVSFCDLAIPSPLWTAHAFKAFATSALVSFVPRTGRPAGTFTSAHFSDTPDWNVTKLLTLLGNPNRAGRTALSDTVWIHSSSLQIFLLSLSFSFFPTPVFLFSPLSFFPSFFFPLFPF